jgi:hypothetical protein
MTSKREVRLCPRFPIISYHSYKHDGIMHYDFSCTWAM